MEKKIYVLPDAEFISFASEDIMTASQTGNKFEEDENWAVWGNWDNWDGIS